MLQVLQNVTLLKNIYQICSYNINICGRMIYDINDKPYVTSMSHGCGACMAVNVGIIGFGRIGAEHAGWLAQAEGIEAVAVADATEARREIAKARGLKAFGTGEELLADTSMDAVLV